MNARPSLSFFLVAALFPALLSVPVLPALAQQKPNIVLVLADDLGWADAGCYGSPRIRTPHLDRLAAQGVRFPQFYANGPECTPTRTALLTGRYQQRVGGLECAIGTGGVGRYDDAIRLAEQHALGLPASEPTLAKQLQKAGYATALIGKWHLGYEESFSPARHGFDHALYCLGGGMDYFHHVEEGPEPVPVLRLNGQPEQREGYFTDLVAGEAVRWLAQRQGQPFFLYLPFTAPHSPYQGPGEKLPAPLPPDSTRWRQSSAPPEVYAAMVESLDSAIGRILEALEKGNLSGQTLVIFTSDNGGTASATPCGLRGLKGQTFEGGIRVPCIARWPGVLPAGTTYPHPAISFDLTASCLRAAGLPPDASMPLDGIDLLQRIAAKEPPPARDLFWRQRRGERIWRVAREGPLKLVALQEGAKLSEFLFDVQADPAESCDLASARPKDASRLREKLRAWEQAVRPVR